MKIPAPRIVQKRTVDASGRTMVVDSIDPTELNRFCSQIADYLGRVDEDSASADDIDDLQTALSALQADLTALSSTVTNNQQSQVNGDVVLQQNLDTHIADTTTHGTSSDIVGVSDVQTLTNKLLDATNKFGGMSNYTQFEPDGTMVAVGDAKTYNDSAAAVVYMRTGGTALTLDVLAGGIYQYRFDKTDEIHSQIQLSHAYQSGSPVDFHIHLVNKPSVGATNYNVGIEVEYMWGGLQSAFSAPSTLATVNCSFQNAAALTHKVFEIARLTPGVTDGTISSYLLFRVKRVAGTTQDLAGNDVFILGIDVHIQQDTQGSREEYVK